MLIFKRGLRKTCADYKFGDIYQFYKELYGDKALPRETVRKIYSKIFPSIVKLMVFETFDYRMPSHLGYLRVKKKLVEPKLYENGDLDTRRLSINWKKTKQLWQKVYPDKTAEDIKLIEDKPLIRELNEKSGGYRMTWFWDKGTCNLKDQTAYYVKITRENCRILSGGVRTNKLNFYE